MTLPLVSVIMNCRNGESYLAEAIDSVYTQSYKEWEIIFFDNNSTDKTADIANSYDERLRYFHNNKTVSLGAARNMAIKYARGKYLAFLDCDDLWSPSKLEKQIAAITAPSPSRPFGFCYTDAMRIDEQGRDIIPYSKERSLYHGNVYLPLMKDCFISMSSCVLDKDICYELDGFDTSLQHVEEWDLWLRVTRKYDLAVVPECLTKIRFHEGNVSRNFISQEIEVYSMLEKISGTKEEELERDKVMKWFLIRFSLINAAHEIRNNFIGGLKSVVKLSWVIILHPLISLRMIRIYFKPNMIKLYKIKYFNN